MWLCTQLCHLWLWDHGLVHWAQFCAAQTPPPRPMQECFPSGRVKGQVQSLDLSQMETALKVQLCPEFPMTSAEDNGRTAFASQINIPPLPAFLTLPHPRVLLVKELPDILSATNLCLRVCFWENRPQELAHHLLWVSGPSSVIEEGY